MSGTRLGLAGIFSTDDPGADLRQIEAEQWDEAEDWMLGYEDDFGYYPEYYQVYFDCPARDHSGAWFALQEFYEGSEEEVTKAMQLEHDKACPCGQPVEAHFYNLMPTV